MALDALPQSELKLSGHSDVNGDAGIWAPSKKDPKLSGKSQISGTVYLESGVRLDSKGKNSHVGATKTADLTALEKQINDLAYANVRLQPTQLFGDIKKSLTIQGNGKLNVIEVDGDIHLSGKESIQLQGTAADTFVLQVLGKVHLSGQSSLHAAGGTSPNRIYIHVRGHEEGHHRCTEDRHGKDFHTSGKSSVDGNVFVIDGKAHLSGKSSIRGALLVSGKIHISGHSHIDGYGKCYIPGTIDPPKKDKDKDDDKKCRKGEHDHDDWNDNKSDDKGRGHDDDDDDEGSSCKTDDDDDDDWC